MSPTHRFRIGSPPIAALAVLPAVVARLRRDFPGAHVEVHEERVATLFTLLQEGAVDALLTPYNATLMTARGMQALHFHKLDDAAFVVIASSRHPLAARRQVELDMLMAEPWIFADTDSYARQMVETAFVRAGLPPPVPVVVSRSPATNIRLVMQGVGLAVVPRSLVEQETAEGLVKPLALRRALPTTPIALVVRAAAEDRSPVRLLIDAVAGLQDGTS